jgi:hypothetical protein
MFSTRRTLIPARYILMRVSSTEDCHRSNLNIWLFRLKVPVALRLCTSQKDDNVVSGTEFIVRIAVTFTESRRTRWFTIAFAGLGGLRPNQRETRRRLHHPQRDDH